MAFSLVDCAFRCQMAPHVFFNLNRFVYKILRKKNTICFKSTNIYSIYYEHYYELFLSL